MSDIMKIIEAFKVPCACGKEHHTTVRDVQIGPGLVHEVGSILKKNDFPQMILLVADQRRWLLPRVSWRVWRTLPWKSISMRICVWPA